MNALQRAQEEGTEPTRQALEAQDRSAPGRVTGRLRKALEAMVWQGAARDEAAHLAGMTRESLRLALAKPHVRAWYLEQLQVLRTSARARNIHRLEEIRDAADNMPAVQAIKALEELDDVAHERNGLQRAPGLQIVIMPATPVVTSEPQVIEHIAQDVVPQR